MKIWKALTHILILLRLAVEFRVSLNTFLVMKGDHLYLVPTILGLETYSGRK